MYKNTTLLYIYTIIYIIYTLPFMAVGLETMTAAMQAARVEVSVNQMVGLVVMTDVVGRGDRRWASRQACAKLCNIQ